MLTVSQLRSRWKTPAGRAAAAVAEEMLRARADVASLQGKLIQLAGNAEVAPALDFRGIELPQLIQVKCADLSGARFDFAQINWSFSRCVLRKSTFDGAAGRNIDFGGCDLQAASFIKAKLGGAMFYNANLQSADLTRIAMRGGQLRGADCRDAKFVGADLRMVWAAETDFRGADLREANLAGASLGGVRWDSATRLDAARVTREGTPEDLLAHALSQGASVGSEKPEWELSLLDATVRALEAELRGPEATALTTRVRDLRPKLERDADFPWANALREQLDARQWEIFQRAVRQAASNMGALLPTSGF
jgi:uncharacterized protein YjbI with pentapeptide repeats